jgi:hypothetical protein
VRKAGEPGLHVACAIDNAVYRVWVNAILPDVLDAAMATGARMRLSRRSLEDTVVERNHKPQLLGKSGTGWDVANSEVLL